MPYRRGKGKKSGFHLSSWDLVYLGQNRDILRNWIGLSVV